MSLDPSDPAPKRRSHIARWLLSFTILAICGVLLLGQKHDKLILTCNGIRATPQEALDACDFLLTWTAKEPSTRSLLHRHKLRTHMRTQNFDDALIEADLAIAEDPESYVPWMWRSTVLAMSNRYEEALSAVISADALSRGKSRDWILSTRIKLLRRLGRLDEVEPIVEDAISTGDVGPGIWRYVGYFRLKAGKHASAAQAFATALRADPGSNYARRKFFEACMQAGPGCPALYQKERASYPSLSCAKAGMKWANLYPALSDSSVVGGYMSGSKPLEDLSEDDLLALQIIVQVV